MKEKQFVLTCKESKEYREKGKTIHPYGHIGYVIANVDGNPTLVGLEPLENVSYEIIVRK